MDNVVLHLDDFLARFVNYPIMTSYQTFRSLLLSQQNLTYLKKCYWGQVLLDNASFDIHDESCNFDTVAFNYFESIFSEF